MTRFLDALLTSAGFFLLGAMIGLAQLCGSQEPKSWRLAIARAVTVGGLSVAAGSILIWLPETPLLGQIGLAAALASLGTSGLERLIVRFLDRNAGGLNDTNG
jgi:hypothetical protein